jgi:hypothetical protein
MTPGKAGMVILLAIASTPDHMVCPRTWRFVTERGRTGVDLRRI